MKREIELSEEESALLVELLEEDQNRLNAEMPPAEGQRRRKQLRRRIEVMQKVVDGLSRETSQVWCDEFLAWSSPSRTEPVR